MTVRRGRRLGDALAILALAAGVILCWWGLNRPYDAPDWPGAFEAVAFSPFQAGQSPQSSRYPNTAEIAQDLALLADSISRVRTYSVTGSFAEIPELAAAKGLEVLLGAWISGAADRDGPEIMRAIDLANSHSNVTHVIVGNEALLRDDLSTDALIEHLRRVRQQVNQPVSTAEPWHIWLDHPRLAAEVDFLAVHILPYWEGIPRDRALDFMAARISQLQSAYPDKAIVLTEVGWPSRGQTVGGAAASRIAQAAFLRSFLNRVDGWEVDYVLLEAFDQPWKIAYEGEAGAYWGIFDASRSAKFPWSGPLLETPEWPLWAGLTVLLGLVPALLCLGLRPSLSRTGRIVFAVLSFAIGAALVWSLRIPAETYLGSFGLPVWVALILAQAALLASLLSDGVEATGSLWTRRKTPPPVDGPPDRAAPMVSIHVPCCDEPPEMVRQTLEALGRLDYPNFEVLVIVNNSRDERAAREIALTCARLGARFHFHHLAVCPGFKAGALNYAMTRTAPRAEIIAVVDSDYIVEPDWLRTLVPGFRAPDVALVQAPQDYRDGGERLFKSMCHWEYAAFFRIGMVERDRANAIIQHGTMTLVRRQALESVGGWGEWCITEDAELGLRLLAAGWRGRYVDRSFGRGLVPDSLAAYKRQRFRWAYGAVQILKRHWQSLLLPGKSRLDWAQRYHFLTGWLPWLTDALGLLCTLAAILWSIALALWPHSTVFPEPAFLVPVLAAFAFKHLRAGLLYRRRVGGGLKGWMRASLAAQALSHAIAKAMLNGLVTRNYPFHRTPKCELRPGLMRSLRTVREELALLTLLAVGFAGVALARDLHQLEVGLWLAVLTVQAVPYVAAALAALIAAGGTGRRDATTDLELQLPPAQDDEQPAPTQAQ